MVHLNLNNEGIQTERSGEAWLPDFAELQKMGVWPWILMGTKAAMKILASPCFVAWLVPDSCPGAASLDFGRAFCAKRSSRATMGMSRLIFQKSRRVA